MKQQHLNINNLLSHSYIDIFIKTVMAIVLIYIIILVINFFRDKYINKDATNTPDILEILTILKSLFLMTGLGFIVVGLIKAMIDHSIDSSYLFLGIILISIGFGFKYAMNSINKDRSQ